jgi:hypothetical protein
MPNKMLNLEKFANGVLSEKINAELEKVAQNIYDENTDAAKKRKITVTITFSPSKNREVSSISINATSTLAPVMPYETNMAIDRDFNTGMIMARELKNQIDGQTEIQLPEEPVEEKVTRLVDLRRTESK